MTCAKEVIDVHEEKNVLVVKFNRPHKKNAFNLQMYVRLKEILNDAALNENITVTVLTGVGDFYSSGNDLSSYGEMMSGTAKDAIQTSTLAVRSLVEAFINFPKILIALVNGPAIGIAATTLALCDIVYASQKSYFLTPFTKLGLVAEGCSSYTFPKILGTKKAAEMLLLNHKMTSSEALDFGFVNEIFSPEEINTKAWDLIFHHASLPKNSLFTCKKLMKDNELGSLKLANQNECDELQKRVMSEEFMQIVMSSLQKKYSKL